MVKHARTLALIALTALAIPASAQARTITYTYVAASGNYIGVGGADQHR